MILLTGASGFIGKHLMHALGKKYGLENVLAFTSKPTNEYPFLLHLNYDFGKDYFLKNNLADKIDTIIHAGSFTPKNQAEANNWLECNKNIYSTSRLLESDLPNLKKVIYLSTLDVYGKEDLISENSTIDPISLYGHSKLYCEKLITAWANAENKTYQVLRIGHVYGPGEESYQKIIPVTIRKIINKEIVEIWGNGQELRSFIFIEDVVNSLLKSLEMNEIIGIVNLVSGQSISINELVNLIIQISQQEVKIKRVQTDNISRNLIFNNRKMKEYLLESETTLLFGLSKEWLYMNSL